MRSRTAKARPWARDMSDDREESLVDVGLQTWKGGGDLEAEADDMRATREARWRFGSDGVGDAPMRVVRWRRKSERCVQENECKDPAGSI